VACKPVCIAGALIVINVNQLRNRVISHSFSFYKMLRQLAKLIAVDNHRLGLEKRLAPKLVAMEALGGALGGVLGVPCGACTRHSSNCLVAAL